MSDSLRLYRTIIEMIRNSQVRFHDMRCLITFAWAIVGVLMEKSVHLSKWGIHRSGEAQAASKQRQFVRWLKNSKIVPSGIYRRLVQTAFADWSGEKIYLALDSSSLWDEFVIVRVELIYRGRALPLSWIILKQQSTTVAFEKYKRILKETAAIVPQGCPVVLLEDRGFDDNDLFCVAWPGLGLSHPFEEVYPGSSGQQTFSQCGSLDAGQRQSFVPAQSVDYGSSVWPGSSRPGACTDPEWL